MSFAKWKSLVDVLPIAATLAGAVTIAGSRPTPPVIAPAGGPGSAASSILRLTTDTVNPPCHPNPHALRDMEAVATRGDVRPLLTPLKQQLTRLAGRPHSTLPIQAFAEADQPSLLFQYYLLDTHNFEPNVFTARIPGVNDQVDLTVTGADCGLPTIGAVRLVLEPKPDLPRDPGDVRAFIDVFEDNARLFQPATGYDRFAVTREINDGMLAPRFANSQRAWVLTGFASAVNPAVPASSGRDSDDR